MAPLGNLQLSSALFADDPMIRCPDAPMDSAAPELLPAGHIKRFAEEMPPALAS